MGPDDAMSVRTALSKHDWVSGMMTKESRDEIVGRGLCGDCSSQHYVIELDAWDEGFSKYSELNLSKSAKELLQQFKSPVACAQVSRTWPVTNPPMKGFPSCPLFITETDQGLCAVENTSFFVFVAGNRRRLT